MTCFGTGVPFRYEFLGIKTFSIVNFTWQLTTEMSLLRNFVKSDNFRQKERTAGKLKQCLQMRIIYPNGGKEESVLRCPYLKI